MSAQQNLELPFWLKMFSSQKQQPVDLEDTDDANDEVDLSGISQDTLARIGRFLKDGKKVVLMGKDKPYQVYMNKKGDIVIEPITQFEFR